MDNDKKPTDNEIRELIERCIKSHYSHEKCVKCYFEHNDCVKSHLSEVLNLFNRQEAEIEGLEARIGVYETCNARKDEAIHRLEAENERLQGILLQFMDEVAKWEEKHGLDVSQLPLIPICDEGRDIIDHYRGRAIDEFAERVNSMFAKIENELPQNKIVKETLQVYKDILQIVKKEMVGE